VDARGAQEEVYVQEEKEVRTGSRWGVVTINQMENQLWLNRM